MCVCGVKRGGGSEKGKAGEVNRLECHEVVLWGSKGMGRGKERKGSYEAVAGKPRGAGGRGEGKGCSRNGPVRGSTRPVCLFHETMHMRRHVTIHAQQPTMPTPGVVVHVTTLNPDAFTKCILFWQWMARAAAAMRAQLCCARMQKLERQADARAEVLMRLTRGGEGRSRF